MLFANSARIYILFSVHNIQQIASTAQQTWSQWPYSHNATAIIPYKITHPCPNPLRVETTKCL